MKIRDKCAECGLELKNTDAGDGPAYTAMFITAPLAVIFALIIESSFEPPMWVHFLISIPFITIASIILLIFLKPVYIALTLKK